MTRHGCFDAFCSSHTSIISENVKYDGQKCIALVASLILALFPSCMLHILYTKLCSTFALNSTSKVLNLEICHDTWTVYLVHYAHFFKIIYSCGYITGDLWVHVTHIRMFSGVVLLTMVPVNQPWSKPNWYLTTAELNKARNARTITVTS